jgi:amino acid transporter
MAQPLETHAVPEDRPPQLLRGFSFRSALSLAFADVSPIAAVYAIFTLGLFAAGPKFFWAFPIVLVGQLLVAAVFGELASRWPYAGSVYQWSRHVRGTTWGWAAAWAYMWGLTIALSALAYGAAGFFVEIVGWNAGRWEITAVALLQGQSSDVVSDTLTAHLGAGVTKPLLAMFVIGFVSSFLAVQAAVSRCIWGAARDRSLPGSKLLGGLAGPERLPVYAIALTAVVAVVFVLMAGSKFYSVLVNFNIIGFYIAFGVPVIGAAIARLTGKWRPGPFNLGRWGAPVTYLASLWIIFETVNVAWPRTQPEQPWYINWASVLTTAGLAVLGLIIYLSVRHRIEEPIAQRLGADAS